ncbi:5-formyltetrahydrofolate cyclo-ligase [Chitinimonas lacunae]|uniref:5-formyltetrahydrofolate cyclo-ligase n=1 Tax=Chitinimonas lacunae TaxID=1963018 RepID=A0ABV8MTW3_9NEIS
MNDKTDLRRQLRRRRAAVPAWLRRCAEQRVAKRAVPWLRRGWRVGAYLALGSELSLAPLMTLARRRGVRLFLPLVPARGRRLGFVAADAPAGRWRRNRYGIAEYHGRQRLAPHRLDAVFVPLVGFDAQGGRLGQGGGYYDTTFAFRLRRRWKKPTLIGVGFECQRVAQIPREAHDAPLDAVLSERAVYRPGHLSRDSRARKTAT